MEWKPTPEQQAALEQQAFVEALLNIRSDNSKSDANEEKSPKPTWLKFLESTGGAAIITVVLGTLGGTIITALVQSLNQQQQARQLSTSEFVKGEHDTVKSAFDLVGESIAASENLNTITTVGFDPANFADADQKKSVLTQKGNLRDEFNKADEHWRATRETLGLNMLYYNGNDQAVGSAWSRTSDAVSVYMDCQHTWYMQHLGNFVEANVAAQACTKERKSLDSALRDLEGSLAKDRLYTLGK